VEENRKILQQILDCLKQQELKSKQDLAAKILQQEQILAGLS
jgi:hypothetical protein